MEVIWCEIVRHVKYLEREWTDGVPLSFRRKMLEELMKKSV